MNIYDYQPGLIESTIIDSDKYWYLIQLISISRLSNFRLFILCWMVLHLPDYRI